MTTAPVCIVGCGPIGLSCALLLAQQGIKTLLLERRSAVNTHPRSRFVDVNTMELMRSLGIEKQVEHTGLGPDWTAFNRWSTTLLDTSCTSIASPSFHTVPNTVSPCLPVMTCQDYVETELLALAQRTKLIDCRFETEATDITQNEQEVKLTMRDVKSGTATKITADYLIGADGPHSTIRTLIGSELEANPLPTYSQDVIFCADLTQQVGTRKGSLLYTVTGQEVTVFQPLDGKLRWRCQLFKPHADDLTPAQIKQRIQNAVGDAQLELEITSTGHWQPTPGCTTKFSQGRVFLAGDAAHISLPTGGMGNNIGFAGARNLAWKLAYVLRAQAAQSVLASYQEEMMPAALKRIAHGVNITNGVRELIMAIMLEEDTASGVEATRLYADYDNIILGHETASSLISPQTEAAPPGADAVSDFVPAVRRGRRAPHIWLDDNQQTSIHDWFSTTYVLVAGVAVAAEIWHDCVARLDVAFPIKLRCLPRTDANAIYCDDGLVLVRPDAIIVDHWRADDAGTGDAALARLKKYLPLVEKLSD